MTSGYNKKAEERAQWREMEDVIFQQKAMIAELKQELEALRASEAENIALLDSVKTMQQITARQSTCPYVLSSDEGTQSCRLNGTLESVLEAIEKELESIPESSYSFQWQENGYGRKPGNFFACEAEWESETEDELCEGLGRTRIEAATACLEKIRKVKRGD